MHCSQGGLLMRLTGHVDHHWLAAFLVATLTAVCACAAAPQAGEDDSALKAARQAVAKGQVERSRAIGSSNPKSAIADTPLEGGVLVGFELGLGKEGKDEVIYALRALYLSKGGPTKSQDFGPFFDKQVPNGKLQKTKVTRTVRIEADPGYAVGGVSLRTRFGITGMQVTFQRLKGPNLDPKQSYTSDWVGEPNKDGNQSLTSNGSPIVGVFGNQDDQQVLALGLIYVKAQTEPAKPPAVAVKPQVERPKKPAEAVKPPVVSVKPPAEAAQPAQPAVQPRVQPKEPPVVEPDPLPPEEPEQDNAKAAAAVPAAVPPASYDTMTDEWLGLLPVVLLTTVFLLAFLGMRTFVVNRNGSLPLAYRSLPPSVIPVVKPAATVPPPLPAADLKTAVSEKPLMIPPSSPSTDLKTAVSEKPLMIPPPLPRQKAASNQHWESPVHGSSQPAFFTGRLVSGMSKRLCRVYLLPRELLLLNAGTENPDQIAFTAMALGGLLGALIGHFIAQSQRKNVAARQRMLDAADTRDLVRIASEERDAVWVGMADVETASFEPISFWRGLVTSNCVALLHLEYRDCGRITLELPTGVEVRMALEHLTPLLSERLVSKVVWDKKRQRFVDKAKSA
jgi:hypothetical protein